MSTPTQDFVSNLSALRAYYPFNSDAPTLELVNGLTMTLTGSPTTGVDMGFAAGDTGVSFNGTNQYATRAHNNAFNPGLGDWSVAFWGIIPSSDGTTRYLVSHDGDGDTGSWDTKHTNSLFQTRFAGYSPGNSSFTPHASTVRLFVFNWDRDGNHTRYIDGTSTYSNNMSSISTTDASVNNALYVGRRASSGSPGYGALTIAHLVLRAAVWTPTEMSNMIAAKAETPVVPSAVRGPAIFGGGFF